MVVAPAALDELDERTRERVLRVEGGDESVALRTFARHPALLDAWLRFAVHTGARSALPALDRERAIVATARLCGCDDDVRRHEPHVHGSDDELTAAVERLVREQRLDDALRERYDDAQLLDLVFTVGHYRMLGLVLHALELEGGG